MLVSMKAQNPDQSGYNRDGNNVFRHLRDAILRVELQPGAIIDESSIAKALNVSRTPVREALIQLIADGLAVRKGRVVSVAQMDLASIPPLYDALLISSRLVQRLAAEMRTDEELDLIHQKLIDFEETIPSLDGVMLTEANHHFHLAIAAATANTYISDFYRSVLTEALRLHRICFSAHPYNDPDINTHLAETARQHRVIFDAISNQDIDAADKLAVEHHKLSRSRLDTLISRQSQSLKEELGL